MKIEDLKFNMPSLGDSGIVTVANIHTIKGLEHEAVLAFTKSEEELLNWLEIDRTKRDEDKDDVCRIGYVAFSRAERLLCLSSLVKVSQGAEDLMSSLGIKIY